MALHSDSTPPQKYPAITDKIKSIENLASIIDEKKKDGLKVVHCHGVFDLIHLGHIRHFQQARALGDLLVVTLTQDKHVNKGAHRPAFTEKLRAEALASLSVVDYVAINQWPTAVETLGILKPDAYCKGGEYRQNQVDAESNMLPEIVTAKRLDIEVVYTDDIVFSSTEILNQHFSPFSPETESWLQDFRNKYSPERIMDFLDDLRDLNVLVIGEAIIDEYVSVNAIGKSTKDPVLACQHVSTEMFAGGSLAVANHLADFCKKVDVLTYLGELDPREDFVRSSLKSSVTPHFIYKQQSPTVLKRRFVDLYSQNKLFELYFMNDQKLTPENDRHLIDKLTAIIDGFDLVIVADYGHGLMTSETIGQLCERAPFLCVNTQSNAGNRGFNPISKYPRADYVCLADHEISIETRLQQGPPRDLLMNVTKRIDCSRFTVTRGKLGSLHYDSDKGFSEAPSLATQVTDRVGAGDAVLALTSALTSLNAPWDVIGFIGNIAGAHMVTELGNRVPINKVSFCKSIISLMK